MRKDLVFIGFLFFSTTVFANSAEVDNESYRNGKFIRTTEHSKNLLDEFSSDGCSMYPDSNPEENWVHCCIAHDINYWYGGTKKEKKDSDAELRRCVTEVTNSAHGKFIETGVSIGGVPSPARLPWEWGYGWRKTDHYLSLSDKKIETILNKAPNVMTAIEILPEDIVGDGLTSEQMDYIESVLHKLENRLTKKIIE